MFGLNSIGWIPFLIGNFAVCLVADLVTVLLAYRSGLKKEKESSDQVRRRRSRRSPDQNA